MQRSHWRTKALLKMVAAGFFMVFSFLSSAQLIVSGSSFPFLHGVASGDATQDHVILWTRVTPFPAMEVVDVKWVVATDASLHEIVLDGVDTTSASRDFTVKIDAGPLESGTWYFYAFEVMGIRSAIGRTRTLPSQCGHFTFAAFSCSNYEAGYFNAYRHAAVRNEVEAIVHLGDYYYEYSIGAQIAGRIYDPVTTLYSLDDYRRRHASTCSDPDLQELRRQYPWYVDWDDHEFANDAWTGGASSHDSNITSWQDRKLAAQRAYFEWMPLRDQEDFQIQRHFEVGNLASLHFVDSRVRERSQPVSADSPALDDIDRTIIGEEQLLQLIDDVGHDSSQWNILLNGVMMTRAINAAGQPIDTDLWEGYRYERSRLWDSLLIFPELNFVSIAGDYHSSWASDLPLDYYNETLGTGSLGCEFVVCSTTSDVHSVGDVPTFMGFNPHVKWIEQTHNGYLVCRITTDSLCAQWKYISTKASRDFTILEGKTGVVREGVPFVKLSDVPIEAIANTISLAPQPWTSSPVWNETENSGIGRAILSPNPTETASEIIWIGPAGELEWQVFSSLGTRVMSGVHNDAVSGLHKYILNTEKLPSGLFFLHLKMWNDEVVKPLVIRKN